MFIFLAHALLAVDVRRVVWLWRLDSRKPKLVAID
jgi:hypothetical protein